MLTLEKKSKSSDLIIHMKAQEPFFEPILIKSFIFAISLHIVAYFLFQITPFHFASTYHFTPVQTIATPFCQPVSQQTRVSLDDEELSFPIPSLMPSLLFPSFSTQLLVPHTDQSILSILENLEGNWSREIDFSLPLEVKEPLVQMDIQGDIADLKLLKVDPSLSDLHSINYRVEPITISYSVRLDEWSGKLFWVSLDKPIVDKERIKKAENILSHLEFEPPSSKENLTGTISFTFLSSL